MKTIKELAPKPSDALKAMIDGLLEQSKRPDFTVDMNDFGHRGLTSKMCFGCAATCAIQKIAGVNLTREDIVGSYSRAEALDLVEGDLHRFELAIDDARRGKMAALYAYYGMNMVELLSNPEMPARAFFSLHNANWDLELPKVQDYVNKIKKIGL